jgi:hypothetical protein
VLSFLSSAGASGRRQQNDDFSLIVIFRASKWVLRMLVTQRTPDTLVVEEDAGTKIMIGSFCAGLGGFAAIVGWTKGQTLFMIIGTVFVLFGLKIFLFSRTRTHRFERWRGTLAIDSKALWGSKRRELPLDRIADVVIEEIRGRGRPSYYIYYVTADGERIKWSDFYDGSKENTLECFNAAREFLEFADATASVKDEPRRG